MGEDVGRSRHRRKIVVRIIILSQLTWKASTASARVLCEGPHSSSGRAPTCSGRSNPMSRHGTHLAGEHARAAVLIGSIAEHRASRPSVSD